MKRITSALALVLFAFVAVADSPTESAGHWPEVLASADRGFPEPQPVAPSKAFDCCKVCSTGKPCGDTCIAREKVCHVGPGCAC